MVRAVDEHFVSDLYIKRMSDRLWQLTAFVRASETGSFSRVARELGMSQASISRMVASLEARLGVKLLLRTTRHVAPTPAWCFSNGRGKSSAISTMPKMPRGEQTACGARCG